MRGCGRGGSSPLAWGAAIIDGGGSCSYGSSPLAWGTVLRPGAGTGHERFILTRVGNRRDLVRVLQDAAVHPHSRGEQPALLSNSTFMVGSSPLAWGTAVVTDLLDLGMRFIPTRVGNRFLTVAAGDPGPVHPHSRGEQVAGVAHVGRPQRFIPTRVGNRSWYPGL